MNSEYLKRDPLDDMIGNSQPVKQVKSIIRQVAGSDITVLITGESGTGKELVARGVHYLSSRRRETLVSANCGAIPEGIFESEIFGHEKGSFTSADRRRKGYFETAHRGTLFLDEIGEMPFPVQVKLLRVLETGAFLRVGGSEEIVVDVRVIAATNKDLASEVAQGRFREDLYYRLKAVNINLPSLRERVEDIPLLVNHFAREFSLKHKRPEPIFDEMVLSILQRQFWAGNVRELRNFIESLIALSKQQYIDSDEVKMRLGNDYRNPNLPMVVSRSANDLDQELIYRTLLELKHELNGIKGLLQQLLIKPQAEIDHPFFSAEDVEAYSLDEIEREQIKRALSDFSGNRRQAAQALGIGERTLYRKIKQYRL